ncbi:MAG: ribonucleotide-diphosphate reductase [Anaerolineae bacterium]|nr:ribonucleotide-diphosphate reductase [Anaerolineae bacterium]
MYLNPDLLPLRDYHKAKKLMWDPRDLDFTQDKTDWAGMDERQQALIKRSLSLFLGGETYVTHDLAPLLVALRHSGQHLEEEMFLTTQLFEESKHVEFFAAVLETVVGEVQDLSEITGENYRVLFEQELSSALNALLTDHSRAAQAQAVATYHMIIEGVLAETGYFGIFTALRNRNLMPGLIRGLELVQRDEARHIAFGLHLLSRLIEEAPELQAPTQERINRLLPVAQGIFVEVFDPFLPEIPFGIDLGEMVTYAGKQYMARMNVLSRATPAQT